MKRIFAATILAGILGLASHANAATVLLNTYTGTNAYTSPANLGFYTSGSRVAGPDAVPFTLTGSMTITDVIAQIATTSTGIYNIGIVADANGAPAGTPGSVSSFLNGDYITATASSTYYQTPVDQSVNWVLGPGNYWLAAYATTGSIGWNWVDSRYPNNGTWAFTRDGVTWLTQTGAQPQPGIELLGTPTPTPLPAALPLFASGLAGMGLIGWRKRRKANAAV